MEWVGILAVAYEVEPRIARRKPAKIASPDRSKEAGTELRSGCKSTRDTQTAGCWRNDLPSRFESNRPGCISGICQVAVFALKQEVVACKQISIEVSWPTSQPVSQLASQPASQRASLGSAGLVERPA